MYDTKAVGCWESLKMHLKKRLKKVLEFHFKKDVGVLNGEVKYSTEWKFSAVWQHGLIHCMSVIP